MNEESSLGFWARRLSLLFLLAFALSSALAGAANAAKNMYIWTDEKGVKHIGSSPPPDVKADDLGAVQPASPKKQPDIEIFVTDRCPYCKKATAYLKEKGKTFKEYNVEHDSAAAKRLRSLTEYTGVPFTLLCGQQLRGFSPASFDAALSKCP
jgi:glutaredoxin